MSDDPRTTFATRWKAAEATLGKATARLDATLRPDAIETAPTMLPQTSLAPITVEEWSHASLPRIALTAAPRESGSASSVASGRSGAEFEVLNILGEGGMGRVHLARQRSLDRDVALKSLRHEVASTTLASSLLHEARVTGGLEHPSIVPLHALGVDERGYPLLVMKRIEGVSWRDLLHDGNDPAWKRLAERDARASAKDRLEFHLDVLGRVCDALEFAHAQGVVHRDVKPENVMIGFFGEVYLVDWGIAIRTHTRTGEPLPKVHESGPAGTPAYMAPEMLLPQLGTIDARTDVFLLGATLHELLTGSVRHAGASIGEVLQSVYLCEPVKYGPDVAAELAALANRATARDPAQRPEGAAAFRRAIAEYLRHRGSVLLADRAATTARELEAVLAEPEPDPTRVARMAGEARFGFAQALVEWSENATARDGLEGLLSTLVDYEIRRRNAAGARALLAEMRTPSESLRDRVDALDRELGAERDKAAQLDAMTHERDERVGARARAYAMAGMVAMAIALSVVVGRTPDRDVTPLLLVKFGALIALVASGTTAIFWKNLMRNQSSRQLVGILHLYVYAMIVHRALGHFAGTPARTVLREDLFIGAVITGATAITQFPWTIWMSVILFAGALVSTFWPARTPGIFGITTLASILVAMFTWLRISRTEAK